MCSSTSALSGMTEIPDGVMLTVKAVPGSSRTEIGGLQGPMLKIKVAAPPEKGKANKALLEFLAGKLKLKKSAVQIQSGQTSCVKQIVIRGVSLRDAEALLKKT
jgi:hypothetical protein